MDTAGRYVTGLEREQFRVFEDGIEQDVLDLVVDTPEASIVVVAAISQDSPWREVALQTAGLFLDRAMPDDEFSLIQFGPQPELAAAWTGNVDQVKNRLVASAAAAPIDLLAGVE
jgi:hypothetical protein